MIWVSYGELRTLIGSSAAEALCKRFGGIRYYIPNEKQAGHAFTPFAGEAAMRALCAAYGGEKIILPNWRRPEPKKAEIQTRLEKGESARAIAQSLAVTERWVETVAREYRGTVRQLSLFPDP